MSSFEHNVGQLYSSDRGRIERPNFSSQITTDRLRESERSSSAKPPSKMKPQRRSIFREEGLDDLTRTVHHTKEVELRVTNDDMDDSKYRNVTFEGILRDQQQEGNDSSETSPKKQGNQAWLSKITKGTRPQLKSSASAPPGALSTLSRSALIVFLIALVVPGFRYSTGSEKVNIPGADAGVIRTAELVENGSAIEGRQNSPTSTCTRWAHQSMDAPILFRQC